MGLQRQQATVRPAQRPALRAPLPSRAPAPVGQERWMNVQRSLGHQAVSRMFGQHVPTGRTPPEFAPAIVHEVLREPGAPLPQGLQTFMQARLHHDLTDIRVHTGDRASASAKAVGASAYAVGHDIVFDAGRYQPSSPSGQRLLAHELAHTVQQSGPAARPSTAGNVIPIGAANNSAERQAEAVAAGGELSPAARMAPAAIAPVLQRQPGPAGGSADTEARLQALFAEYHKVKGKPVPASMQEWARKYEAARQNLPQVPPLDVERLAQAVEHKRIYMTDPPLPQGPLQLAPGAVGANDIFPFAKGTRLVVTHLLGEILGKVKDLLLFFAKTQAGGGDIAAEAPLLIDLLTDPDVSKSVDAVVLESSPTLFEAKIMVPNVPAKGARPAITAREIRVTLEAVSPEPKFDLTIEWGTGRSSFGDIAARRVDGKIVTSFKPTGTFSVDLTLTREPGGGVVVETEHDLVRALLGATSLKLVRIDPLGAPAGSSEEARQKEAISKKAAASATTLPSPHEVTYGSSLVWAQGAHAMYSAGWRFVFRPGGGDVLRAPFAVQLDYVPKTGLGTAGVSLGGELKIPASVPVTLSILPGIKGGAVGLGGAGSLPVFGPSVGVRVGVDVGKGVNVYLGGDYFHNMLDAAQKKDVKDVPSLTLGATLRL